MSRLEDLDRFYDLLNVLKERIGGTRTLVGVLRPSEISMISPLWRCERMFRSVA